jgi:putative MFS transporter
LIATQDDLIGQLNARIDRLPGWSLPWYVFGLVAVSYFFAFYDIQAIGFTLPTLIPIFRMTGYLASLPVTLNLVGYIVGAVLVGHIADSLGRRTGLMVTVVVLTLGAILTALSWNAVSFSIFRFITGLGIGAELAIAASLLSEFTPNRSRARFLQINFLVGAMALGFTGLFARPLLGIGANGWRFVFLVGALAGVAMIIARAGALPESPRWSVLKGRPSEAEALVLNMESTALRRYHLEKLPDMVPPVSEEAGHHLPFLELLKPPYIGRLILMTSFWFFDYLQSYSYYGYEPTLLIHRGVTMHSSLLASALADIGSPVGALLLILLVTRIERKYLIGVGIAICGLLEILSTQFVDSTAITIVLFFAVIFQVSAAVGYLLNVEVFPTRARTQGMAISDGVGHLGGAIAPIVVVALLTAYGGSSGFYMMGMSAIIAGFIVMAFAPRIGNRRLQEISS